MVAANSPTYSERLRAGVERYGAEQLEQLLAFRRLLHGDTSALADPSIVKWLYEQAPHRVDSPALWLYRHRQRIVAQQGALPVLLKVGSMVRPAAWAIHLAVEPVHRLRGIGAVLSAELRRTFDLVLGVEVSSEARQAFLKAGWRDLGTLPFFSRPLDLHKLAGRSRLVPRVLAAALLAPWQVVDGAVLAVARRLGVTLVEADSAGVQTGALDDLWRDASPGYGVVVRRSAKEIVWRILDYPRAGRYQLLYVTRAGVLLAYVVVRLQGLGAARRAFIVDFFCQPRWTWLTLGLAVDWLVRHTDAAVVHCLHLGRAGERALAQLGFVRRDSHWPLMWCGQSLAEGEKQLLDDRRHWFVTAADSDVDRPRENTFYTQGSLWRPSLGERCASTQ